MKDVWKSTTTVPGEQSVMTSSTMLTLQLFAKVLAPGVPLHSYLNEVFTSN